MRGATSSSTHLRRAACSGLGGARTEDGGERDQWVSKLPALIALKKRMERDQRVSSLPMMVGASHIGQSRWARPRVSGNPYGSEGVAQCQTTPGSLRDL